MSVNVNRVVLTGNLTHDPELHPAPEGGTARCRMRVAVNGRRKDQTTKQWIDKPNYLTVTVFGVQAENCGKYLKSGRMVGVDGRLDWHAWEDDQGSKRSSVSIIAETVQFLGAPPAVSNGDGGSVAPARQDAAPAASGNGTPDDEEVPV